MCSGDGVTPIAGISLTTVSGQRSFRFVRFGLGKGAVWADFEMPGARCSQAAWLGCRCGSGTAAG